MSLPPKRGERRNAIVGESFTKVIDNKFKVEELHASTVRKD